MDTERTFDELPLAAKRRIDAICARFEEAWQSGRPTVEEFLGEPPALERAVLLAELLHTDIEFRRRLGENPVEEDYLQGLPGDGEVIRTVLAEVSEQETGYPGAHHKTPGPPAVVPPGLPVVPGYEMMEELGRGGMGVVYMARHLALNRIVALKFILAGRHAAPRHIGRFRLEAEAVARLRHPNIVQIYDIGEAEGRCFIALEHADAGSLRDRLLKGPLEPRTAARLLEPVVRAVQHAHRQGVVHRDIKPANILLSAAGDSLAHDHRPLPDFLAAAQRSGPMPLAACTAKLTDFGMARMLGGEEGIGEFGMAAGTPSYMAPEQATGEGGSGQPADVWALGATLYECLTGRPPFRAGNPIETLHMVLDVEPVPPSELVPGVPRDLETICLKCLQKNPANRYAGARELAQDLKRFMDGEPIQARRATIGERAMVWVRRHRWRLALGAGLLAGLALVLWVLTR